jgi:HK97 family phage prohead protease
VIQRGAFRRTIAAWQASGKRIPLAWNHETGNAEQLIGSVDPASMRETRAGLVGEASLDLESSPTAREVWRLVKSDSIGVSFGYMADEIETGDGTRLLTSIDLYEISLTATPMHPDAKVVSWKSTTETDLSFMPSNAEIRARAKGLEIAELAKSARPIKVARFEC